MIKVFNIENEKARLQIAHDWFRVGGFFGKVFGYKTPTQFDEIGIEEFCFLCEANEKDIITMYKSLEEVIK